MAKQNNPLNRRLHNGALMVTTSALLLIPTLGREAVSATLELAPALRPVAARTHTEWTDALQRALGQAINPGDYECGPTAFAAWIDGKIGQIQNQDNFWFIVENFDVLSWPTYYKLFIDNFAGDEFIGAGGESTQEMKKRLQDLQHFWDVSTEDVVLEGMHGADIQDTAKMVPFLQFTYGVSQADAELIVALVQAVIESDPGLGYNHPIFTLNAFAVTYEGEPADSPFFGFSDKIVFGDGIIEFLSDLGLGQDAPDMIMAHEFGHHVQYELGLFDVGVPESEQPAATRRTELMADAFGAYFSAHARGAAFQAKRIVQTFEASYLVGDCGFDIPDHHGTPNQRAAAAQWGATVAESARKQGKINSSVLMLQLFEAQLPVILAPDKH